VIYLADNDIILKLAQCDLIDLLPEILGSSCEEIFVSPTAKYQLLPKKSEKALKKCGNEQSLKRLTFFLNRVTVLSEELIDLSLLVTLNNIDGIDSGEDWLFAAAVEMKASFLFTGDKRALKALLAHKNEIPQVVSKLENKVVTFESIILLAIKHLGFAVVKQKLLGSPKPDGMLKLALKNDAKDLEECLISFSSDIKPLLAFKELLPEKLINFQ